MLAQDLVKECHLGEAIEAQLAETRSFPADADRRHLLFTLLAFAGDLERAHKQADALGTLAPALESWAEIYRGLLAAENERRRVHREGASPLLPKEPPPHLTRRLEALAALRAGDAGTARTVLAAAAGPALGGRIDGVPFTAIADADDALGGVLEVFAGGRYLWVPWERIRRLDIPEPRHLIDTLWVEARLEEHSGVAAVVYLPVLYEGSWSCSDDRLRLGRITDWTDSLGVAFRGSGQRVLAVERGPDQDPEQRALLTIRTLELEPAT